MNRNKYLGFIVFFYLALKPIYLWSSGGMQICDIFMAVSTLYLIIKFRGKFELSRPAFSVVLLFLGLCIYQFIINLIWTAVLEESLLRNSLFYFFNFIAFFDLIFIGSEIGLTSLKKNIAYGGLVSLGISAIGLVIAGVGGRQISFFNNPNQLGYHALSIFSFGFLCKDRIKKISFYTIILVSTWLVIASGSKAAFLAIAGMYLFFIIYYNREGSIKKIVSQMIITIALLIAFYLFFFSDSRIVLSNPTVVFMRRRILQMRTENDTALGTGRGYNRILETGIHFFWGMGEGANHRFLSMTGMEAHSSYVTLLVCYGLIGMVGYFGVFMKCIMQRNQIISNLFVMSGMLFYGVSHNGLRNTLLWLLLASVFLNNNAVSYEKTSNYHPYIVHRREKNGHKKNHKKQQRADRAWLYDQRKEK